MPPMLSFDKTMAALLQEQIEAGIIPRYLYKFRAIEHFSLTSLANNTLWFSRLESFNDPYEGSIVFSNTLKADTLKMLGEDINSENISVLEEHVNHGIHRLHESQSVCCFSDSFNDILLWSHYADWHKGLCLKFDLTKNLEFFSPIVRVSYEKQKKSSDNLNDFVTHFFQRKFIEWEYEKEYRVIKPINPGPYKYSSEALVEVIFGCRTNEDDKHLIKTILHGSRNVNYKQCKLDEDDFKLVITDAEF